MVLTVRVRTGDERAVHSRREVLRAGLGAVVAAVSLAACDSAERAGGQRRIPDPLNPFYRDTAALLSQYEATIIALPALAGRLTPLLDDHRQHVQALAREIGPGLESSAPSTAAGRKMPTAPDAALGALRAAERDATAAARSACLSAPSYRAALLGSIAAARASHAEALA
jgi:hypothetical protein